VSQARSALVGASFRQAALAVATFAQSDLRNADFSGADLRSACFDRAILDGAHLEGATLLGATFTGVPIAALLTCGLSPRDLLSHRAGADQRCFRRLLFGPQAPGVRFAVTAQEAATICRNLSDVAWDRLDTAFVFAALYPGEAWVEWLARCASRRVLTWAVAHRTFLQSLPERPFVHYGRVAPSTLLDEVTEEDLRQGGTATNPERLFNAIGTRRLQAQANLGGSNSQYPRAPFATVAGVAQITSRHDLELEGARMGHCVAGYDDACQAGECYIFHVGEPAPRGSTLEVLADGSIGQHFARYNGDPGWREVALVEAWQRAQARYR
jgi:uncharacterized protein YjbI with pentapeptide repeats